MQSNLWHHKESKHQSSSVKIEQKNEYSISQLVDHVIAVSKMESKGPTEHLEGGSEVPVGVDLDAAIRELSTNYTELELKLFQWMQNERSSDTTATEDLLTAKETVENYSIDVNSGNLSIRYQTRNTDNLINVDRLQYTYTYIAWGRNCKIYRWDLVAKRGKPSNGILTI